MMRETLITSSVLIICIVLLRRLSRGRIGAGVQYVLWLIVAVRLLLPGIMSVVPELLPKSDLSIMNIADQMEDRAQDYMGQSILQRPVSLSLPVGGLPFLEGASSDGPTAVFVAGKLALTWMDFFRRIWYLGMILTGSWMLFVNLRFLFHLRKNRRRYAKENFKLRVYLVKEIASPCLYGGVFRPAVYVPEDISEEEEKMRHVLAHEYCHYRHGDVLWAMLRCVLVIVYWFHPLVWLAAVLSRQDCELACDEAALRMLGEEERIAYGKTLVSLIARRTKASDIACTATTMTAGTGGIRERIRRIAGKPRKLLVVLLLVIAAAGAVVTFTFTQAKKYPEGTYLLTEEDALTVTTDSFQITFPEELAQKVYCLGQNDADVIVYHKNSDHEVGRFRKMPYAEGMQLARIKGAIQLGLPAENSVSVIYHEYNMDAQGEGEVPETDTTEDKEAKSANGVPGTDSNVETTYYYEDIIDPEAEINIEVEEWEPEEINESVLDPIPAPEDVQDAQWIELPEPTDIQRKATDLSDEENENSSKEGNEEAIDNEVGTIGTDESVATDVYLPSEQITTTVTLQEDFCYLYISAEYTDADESLREELTALDGELRSLLDSVTIFYVSADDMEQIRSLF